MPFLLWMTLIFSAGWAVIVPISFAGALLDMGQFTVNEDVLYGRELFQHIDSMAIFAAFAIGGAIFAYSLFVGRLWFRHVALIAVIGLAPLALRQAYLGVIEPEDVLVAPLLIATTYWYLFVKASTRRYFAAVRDYHSESR